MSSGTIMLEAEIREAAGRYLSWRGHDSAHMALMRLLAICPVGATIRVTLEQVSAPTTPVAAAPLAAMDV